MIAQRTFHQKNKKKGHTYAERHRKFLLVFSVTEYISYICGTVSIKIITLGVKTQSFLCSSFTVAHKKKGALVWEVRYFPVVKVRSQCGGCRPLGFVQTQIIDAPFPRPCPSSVPIGQFSGISLGIVTTGIVHCPINPHS